MRGWAFICGDGPLEARSGCPNALHDYPLPSSYVGAHEEAARRLRRRWSNTRCPDCDLYGWRPGPRDASHPCTTPTIPAGTTDHEQQETT